MQLLCPKCHNIMNQYERNRVLVDQCTECKGIFLDRGELEHLVEAEKAFYGSPAAAAGPSGARAPEGHAPEGGHDQQRHDQQRHDHQRYDHQRYDHQRYDHQRYDQQRYDDRRQDYGRDGYDERDRAGGPYRKKRRGSMLEDLFDFG